jgi:hypothetical protein
MHIRGRGASASTGDREGNTMSDLDEAKLLLEKIAFTNKTKLGNTDVTYVTLALEILLKDYIERASREKRDAEKLS